MINAGRKYRAIFLYLYFYIFILIFKYLQMERAEQRLINTNNIIHVIHHCSYFSFPKDVCIWKVVLGVTSKEHLTSKFFFLFSFSLLLLKHFIWELRRKQDNVFWHFSWKDRMARCRKVGVNINKETVVRNQLSLIL